MPPLAGKAPDIPVGTTVKMESASLAAGKAIERGR